MPFPSSSTYDCTEQATKQVDGWESQVDLSVAVRTARQREKMSGSKETHDGRRHVTCRGAKTNPKAVGAAASQKGSPQHPFWQIKFNPLRLFNARSHFKGCAQFA
jgi:hypothetical protein